MNKKLTADRIKQLEDNANIMKEGGYSDEDIQAMSNQFIEEYGVDDTVAVKKKDTPTPSTFGGSASPTQNTRTDASATQSQQVELSINSQFNMMSFRNQIPETQIPHENKIAYAKKAYRNNPLVPQGISDEDLHTVIEKNVTKNPDAFNKLAHQVKRKEERDTHIANSSVDELLAQNNDELQHAYKTNTFTEYQQSRFGKAVSYLNDIKDGVNISEKDAEYIKSVAPTAFNELVPDGNLQAAINVNRANKQAQDAASAYAFNETKKSILTQANIIDANSIATIADQVKVAEVSNKQLQQKDIEIKNLKEKYPPVRVGDANMYNEFVPKMDFPPEYYAELKKVNEKYDVIGNYLGSVHGTEFAKTQKDALVSGTKSAYDIGIESLKIQNKKTHDQYLAGGQKSQEVKAIATKLGIESMIATGDPDIIRKAQIEQSEFFKKYPKELDNETRKRLSVEWFKRKGIAYGINETSVPVNELDKVAESLPQQFKDNYFNRMRPSASGQFNDNRFKFAPNLKAPEGYVGRITLDNPGGGINSFITGFTDPFIKTADLLADISGTRTKKEVANEVLKEQLSPEITFDKNSLNQKISEIKAKPKKTYQDLVELQQAQEVKDNIPSGSEYVNRISSTVGMVGSIALQSQILAGVVGEVAGVSQEGLIAMQQGVQTETTAAQIANYASKLKNIGAGTGQVAMAATMADDMYKSAIRLMPNDNQATQRVAYTALLTTMWGAVSRIMPFEKVFKGLTPEAETELANLAKEVTQKSVTKEALTSSLGKILDKYVLPFAKGTATDLAKVTAEMTGAQVITQAADAVANPSEFNPEAAKEAVVHTLLNTPIDMILVAGMNGIREVSKNPMSIATLSSLSNEKVGQQFIDVVQAQMQKGDITPKEATEKIQIVNTLQDISKKEMPEVQAIKSLTQKESDMYKVLLLNEKLLRKKMDDSKDAVLNKVYETQIKESETKRQNILGEDYIVDSDYNLKSVEDANKEMSTTETNNAEVGSGSEASGKVDATTETAPKSDTEIEKRMAEIEGDSKNKDEFNSLEKEMEKRERASVFNVPLGEVNNAVDRLIAKEKEKPNGFGSFIENRDARETKEVTDRYLDAKKLTDVEVETDFSDAVRGNPTTWYADGLKLRESLKEATNRGIDTQEMLDKVVKIYEDAGYDTKTAKSVVAGMLNPVFEGSKKVNEKQISESKPTNSSKSEIDLSGKTSEELYSLAKETKDKMRQQEDDILGDRASEYRTAKMNGDTEKVNEIESTLTKEQGDTFFGRNEASLEPTEINRLAQKVSAIEQAENVNDLAASSKNALVDLANGRNELESKAVIEAVSKKADELGITKEQLGKEALSIIGDSFKDKNDAKDIIDGILAQKNKSETKPTNSSEPSKSESKVNFEAKNNDNLGTPEVVAKNSDGKVIGNVTTSFDPKDKNALIVQSIDVKPSNQNKGVGKQLYLELAKSNPDKTIKSSPRLSGEYAIKAWESLVRDGIAEKVGENKYEINSKKEVDNSEKLIKEKESEIENLKMEMDSKIRDLKKEKLEIDFPSEKKIAYSEDALENKDKFDSIKKRLSILDDIIKCL